MTNDRIYEDLEAAHRHASVDPARIAAWGFCMGGWASVLAASGLPIAAAISFYGGGLVGAGVRMAGGEARLSCAGPRGLGADSPAPVHFDATSTAMRGLTGWSIA